MKMYRNIWCFCLLLFCIPFLTNCGSDDGGGKGEDRNAPGLSDFKAELVWSEEFNEESLNTSKWTYRQLGNKRWDAYITDEAIIIANGLLEVKTYSMENSLGELEHFTGMLGTQGLFEQKFGVFEARIDFKSSPGMWSAFWLQSPTIGNPVDNPELAGVEIDIVEHRARNKDNIDISNTAHQALHWNGYQEAHKKVENDTPNIGISEGFHIYSLVWTPESYLFYIDNELVKVWSGMQVPISNKDQYIIISSEVRDNNWAGTIPSEGYGSYESSQTSMVVDYVRVYSLNMEVF